MDDIDRIDAINDIAARIWFIRSALAARPELNDEAIDGLISILDGIFDTIEVIMEGNAAVAGCDDA